MQEYERSQVKFGIINKTLTQDNNLLRVSSLCQMAGVSRSGYYNWLKKEDFRKEKERKDCEDFALILEAYRHRGYKKGARAIHMRLLHNGIRMNLKKIRRLMRKFGLFCPIRKPKTYSKMLKDMRTNKVADNIVNRDFTSKGARKVLLTDITYLPHRNGKCYLSTIIDACTKEVLAYNVSSSLKVDFVLKSVEKLVKKYGSELNNATIIHSDQGTHYTSLAFIKKLKEKEFVQSM